jgi:hypothetical protein
MPDMKSSTLGMAAAVALALGLGASSLMASQAAHWEVVAATNATMTHGKSLTARIVTVGAVVDKGDRLTTGADGTLVLSRGEDLITMAEKTQIVIVDPQPAEKTLIQEPYGMAQYHVTKGPVPHFEVDTPLLATVVKGTTFSVAANPSEGAVAVSEGRVVARRMSNGAFASVSAGQVGRVAEGASGVKVGAGKLSAADVSGAASPSSPSNPNSPATASTGDSSDKDPGGDSDTGSSNDGKGKSSSGSGHGNGNSSNGNSGNGNSGNGNSGNSGNGNGGSGSGNSGKGNGNGNNGNGNGNGGSNGSKGGRGHDK